MRKGFADGDDNSDRRRKRKRKKKKKEKTKEYSRFLKERRLERKGIR